MKKYTDQGKVDTRSGLDAGDVTRSVKKGISYVSVIFLLLMTASCTLCDTLDRILNPGRKVVSWTVEYELNGNNCKDTGYVYAHPPLFSSPPYYEDDYWALSFCWDYNHYQHTYFASKVPMSILMATSDLYYLFTDDEKSRFLVNHKYRFNERCRSVYNAGDTDLDLYMDYEVLDGSYSFEVKKGLKDYSVIVHFEVDEVITGLHEWYDGPLSVGDRITIKNGRLVQYGIEGSYLIDNTFEL